MLPALQALVFLGDSANNEELSLKAADIAGVTQDAQAAGLGEFKQTSFNYNLGWAKSYLKKIGAVENSSRGIWSLTQRGKSLSATSATVLKSLVQQKAGPEKKSEKESLEADIGVHPEAHLAVTEAASLDWRDQLLKTVRTMAPAAFERLAQRLLREAGFLTVEVTGRSGDGGIDGTGVLRIANVLSFYVLFQCKRYQGSVGASAIRDFRGAMTGRSDKGLFLTTGTFTADAKKEASRDGAPAIDLIDGEQLCELLKALKLGIITAQVEAVTVDSTWFEAI